MVLVAARLVLCIITYSILPCTLGFKVVDLSHPINARSPTWPANPGYNFTIMFRDYFFDDQWLENNKFCMPEHMGTHLDAPAHFGRGKRRVHEIPIENLVGPGVIIDIREKAKNDRDYRVSISDVKEWEKTHGKIPEKAVVLMNSGGNDLIDDESLYWGSSNIKDLTSHHFPGWHEDAVLWLIKNRKINIIGVDRPSVDTGNSRKYRAHATAAANNIAMLENVANLDSIPPSGSMIYANVIKIEEGSGGPTRVIAVIGGTSTVKAMWILTGLCIILNLLIYF